MTQFKLNFSVRGHRKTALLAFTGALAVLTVACSSDTESPTVTPAARISPVPPTVVVAPTAITPAAPPTDLADSVASPTPAGAETPTVEATPMAQGASTAPTATPAPTATAAPDPAEFVIIAKQPRVEPPPPSQPTGPPPVLDRTRASVSIDRIVFDTFGGSSVRLSDATFEMIERLRDVIRPIYEPSYEDVDGGGWLKDRDLVLGYVGVDAQYAYPIKMLNFHELVNDVIDGIPVLVTYCPLCGSGIVFDRQLGGDVLTFGNTNALFENDLVMFDYGTGSYWFQTAAEALVGPLTGNRLAPLPSVTMPWGEWKKIHPDTQILSRKQAEVRRPPDYTSDPFAGDRYSNRLDDYKFPFLVDEAAIDTRLRPSEIAITLRVDELEKAYPVGRLGDAVVNDEINGEPVVVFSRQDGSYGQGFSRTVDGRVLNFRLDDGEITDEETGSAWDISGNATSGQLEGSSLDLLTARRAFWFSLAFAVPDVPLYDPS